MMSEPENGDVETKASEEQAVDVAEATDADTIRERLPEDIRERLTKKAFTPGSLRRLLRDTYFIGPIGIGRGGWRGVYGGGKPGTELRRPEGALYNFPRSWRFAALQRALETGVLTHVGSGQFAITERGVAVLRMVDECPDCGVQREPYIRHHHYVANPNTGRGHVESHTMVTACPECGANGYGGDGGNSSASYEDFNRDEDAVERAVESIADTPEARTYGGERPVSEDAAHTVPDVDLDAISEVLDEFVENYSEPDPREVYGEPEVGEFSDIYDREVVTVPSEGDLFKFYGNGQAVVASLSDERGDVHIVVRDTGEDGEDRLDVRMSYEVAVEGNAKSALPHRGGKWDGNVWSIDAHRLGDAISALTAPGDSFGEDRTVTVTEDAAALSYSGLPGLTEDRELET